MILLFYPKCILPITIAKLDVSKKKNVLFSHQMFLFSVLAYESKFIRIKNNYSAFIFYFLSILGL